MLIGPTGSGKTLLAQTLVAYDVPFALADATTLTEAGYVGEDVENIVQKLLQAAEFDVERAQKALSISMKLIKSAVKAKTLRLPVMCRVKVYSKRCWNWLKVRLPIFHRKAVVSTQTKEMIQVDTSNILVICGGAFAGLDNVIQQRTEKTGIGFNAEVKSQRQRQKPVNCSSKSSQKIWLNLVWFPELIGRLPVVATLEELDEEALVQI